MNKRLGHGVAGEVTRKPGEGSDQTARWASVSEDGEVAVVSAADRSHQVGPNSWRPGEAEGLAAQGTALGTAPAPVLRPCVSLSGGLGSLRTKGHEHSEPC